MTSPTTKISIHTPLAGSDGFSFAYLSAHSYFNPHSPCGERLEAGRDSRHRYDISIHTPLAGSDFRPTCAPIACCDFNPHSPCGERLVSARTRNFNKISIHTPLAGSDLPRRR